MKQENSYPDIEKKPKIRFIASNKIKKIGTVKRLSGNHNCGNPGDWVKI
jgi:hypothetical protein